MNTGISFGSAIRYALLPPNDRVNAAGAFDYDFKIRVIARSRSTLGSAGIGA